MADRSGYIGRNPGDSSVVIARQTFEPTGIQTDFTFASGYTPGYLDVYINGVRLVVASDYTATDGSVIGLTTHADNGDVLECVAYKAFNVSNVDSTPGNFTVGVDLTVGGNLTAKGDLIVGDNTGGSYSADAAGCWIDNSTGYYSFKENGATTDHLTFYKYNTLTPVAKVSVDGDATFSGEIRSGGNPHQGQENGSHLNDGSGVSASYSVDAAYLWRGYKTGNQTPTSSISVAGVGIFSGGITCKNEIYVDGTTTSTQRYLNFRDEGQNTYRATLRRDAWYLGTAVENIGDVTPGSAKIKLGMDGVGIFSGTVESSSNFKATGTTNTEIWTGYKTDEANFTSAIYGSGAATFAATNTEIDSTGQLTIKKAASYTDPSFRILDRENNNANGVLMYGNGTATFAGDLNVSGISTLGITSVSKFTAKGTLIEGMSSTTTAYSNNNSLNITNGNYHFSSANLTGTVNTVNIMSDTGINTDLAINQVMNVTAVTSVNATTAYINRVSIDGLLTGITTHWVGGSAPTDGGGSGLDIYSFNVMKTGNETYIIIANQMRTSV